MEDKYFDDTLAITLPDGFEDMKEEMVEIIYQNENKPQVIKISADGRVHITLSRTALPLSKEQLPQLTKMIKQNIATMQPANQFFEEGCELLETVEYGWFDFKGYALDGEVYYLNAMVIVNKKMHHVSFCAPFSWKDTWKPKFFDVLNSIKDLSK